MNLIILKFFRQYGAPILALGLGALYVWTLNVQNDRLREKITIAEGREATYILDAQRNAVLIGQLGERLLAEQDLAGVRIEAEQDRRTAAEGRNNRLTGAINGLRTELEGRECGVGPVLSDGLRINRQEREADRRSREAAIGSSTRASVSPGG